MSDEERAREIFGGKGCDCHESYRIRGMIDPTCVWCEWGEDVIAALSAVRRETIERCAGVADAEAELSGCGAPFDDGWECAADYIAKSIRALDEQRGKGEA